MATHSSIFSGIIAQTEEPGRRQSTELQSRTQLSTHARSLRDVFIFGKMLIPLEGHLSQIFSNGHIFHSENIILFNRNKCCKSYLTRTSLIKMPSSRGGQWQRMRRGWTISVDLECVSESLSVMSDPLQPHGLYGPWNSLGQNTGVGSLSLLQGIFPTQGSNPGIPHHRQILYQLSYKGSPRILEWVAYPLSSRSSQPRN